MYTGHSETCLETYHCHKRPPVLKDHTFLAEGPHFSGIEPVIKDPLS